MEISEELNNWLVKKAQEELASMSEKQMSYMEHLLSSKDKINKNKAEIAKSAGRIDLIKEILQLQEKK